MRDKKNIEKFDRENDLWETRQLGASADHAVPVSDEEDKALDDAMGLQLLSFRIQKTLIKQLKALSVIEGIGYQPFMRQILTRYVNENQAKLNKSSPVSISKREAETLFETARQQSFSEKPVWIHKLKSKRRAKSSRSTAQAGLVKVSSSTLAFISQQRNYA